MSKWILMSIALFLVPNASDAAENLPVKSIADVTGCWERIRFSDSVEKEMNRVEPWPLKFQVYCFEADGTLYSASSSAPMEVSAASLRATFATMPKDISFQIPQEGILVTNQPSADQRLAWGAYIYSDDILFDGQVVARGTLVMSLYSEKEKRNAYYRYLRKLE